jgi:hypothetical protein
LCPDWLGPIPARTPPRLTKRFSLTALVAAGGFTACTSEEVDIGAVGQLDYQGRVERIETLGRYSRWEACLLLQMAGPPAKLSTQNDYFLYRVIYPSVGVDGSVTRVSGLVAVPATHAIKGVEHVQQRWRWARARSGRRFAARASQLAR